MRALFMDFPEDPNVRDVKYEYMFGPAFLVAPVCTPGANTREVYLPNGADWCNYWTGEHYSGGQTIRVDAPLDTLPLFVRAGSIIPFGDPVEHTGIPQNKLQVHVYEGEDAHFELYRDDGTTYAHENGDYTLTALHWDDKTKTLRLENDTENLFPPPQSDHVTRIRS